MSSKVFISHASEDKEDIARPLAKELRKLGIDVWFDEYSLQPGDSLRRSIEDGVGHCDYGIVILSKNFFNKEWTQRELDSLTAKEIHLKKKVIIPVWHGVDFEDVAKYSYNLVDKLSVKSSNNIVDIAKRILGVVTQHLVADSSDIVDVETPNDISSFFLTEFLWYLQKSDIAILEYFADLLSNPDSASVTTIGEVRERHSSPTYVFIDFVWFLSSWGILKSAEDYTPFYYRLPDEHVIHEKVSINVFPIVFQILNAIKANPNLHANVQSERKWFSDGKKSGLIVHQCMGDYDIVSVGAQVYRLQPCNHGDWEFDVAISMETIPKIYIDSPKKDYRKFFNNSMKA